MNITKNLKMQLVLNIASKVQFIKLQQKAAMLKVENMPQQKQFVVYLLQHIFLNTSEHNPHYFTLLFLFMPILKGVSSCICPELLKVLAEMGHSDQIGSNSCLDSYLVIADANFPAASIASHCPGGLIRLDGWISSNLLYLGHDIPRILRGICKLLPLDQYVDCPVELIWKLHPQAQVMAKMECDKDMEIPIIDEYVKIMSEAENREVGSC